MAGSSDPWLTALPGAYGAGSAGNILGTNLDATVSTRAKEVDLGDMSGDNLTSVKLKFGNDTINLTTRLATLLADILLIPTAPALASSWTAALATALGNYTAARAAYLDNINQAGLLQVTAARAGYLDELATLKGATGVLHEQAMTAGHVSVDNTLKTVLDLSAASTRYVLRNLRFYSIASPGANTMTITLTENTNIVDTFVIDATNYQRHLTLMDMFGEPHIAGDVITIYIQGSAVGPYDVYYLYSYAKTNN